MHFPNHTCMQLMRAAGAILDQWQMPPVLRMTYRALAISQGEGVAEGGCVVGGKTFVAAYNGVLLQVWASARARV